jgi:ribosome-associated protein
MAYWDQGEHAVPRARNLVVTAKDRRVVIPAADLEWQFARSAGPGGQHVNRTSSKAMLRFDAAGCPHISDDIRRRLLASVRTRLTAEGALVITSQRHREQGRNVADCIEKLSALIERAMVPPERRRPTRVPHASRAARLDSKKRRGATKRLRRIADD